MSKYKLSFKSTLEFVKYLEDKNVQFIDYNFTDMVGNWRHITRHISVFDNKSLEDGIYIDAPITGCLPNNYCSNILLKPDLSRVSYNPFSAQKTIKVFCSVYSSDSRNISPFDTRYVAGKAQEYVDQHAAGDTLYLSSVIEFFVFDNVKITNKANQARYNLDSEESHHNAGHYYSTGNMGHRPVPNGKYAIESPIDSLSDIRAEMLGVIESTGAGITGHSHGSSSAQCVLNIRPAKLLECADNIQLCKYVVRNVAHSYGKSATFMPKPVNGEDGSGLHVNHSLLHNGKSMFSEAMREGLSKTALYYAGGILKHSRALNAFTNPSTNSYKRLIQNHITPYLIQSFDKQIKTLFPDPTANPYLALSALVMAGLDGVENEIDPKELLCSVEKNIPDCASKAAIIQEMPQMSFSLQEALSALESDHLFLLKGGVFTKEIIDFYIKIKTEEINRYEKTTHPIEVDMYYSS